MKKKEKEELKKEHVNCDSGAGCSKEEAGKETCECEQSEVENDDNEEVDPRIAELTAKLEEAEKKNNELSDKLAKEKDDYLRLMAEFETFRRRNAEEKLELVNSAASETIRGILPVLDDCERAMELLEKSSDESAKEGTGLIYNKLMQYLKKKGLEKIEAKGQKFDTDFHEAVAQIPVQEEDKKGLVYDVIETGYKFDGKILRFAKVVVGV